jgi:4-amino-4-deoxy-L-arabinose transferase-like glycosyltransferase
VTASLLSARDRAVWAVAFLVVSAAIVGTRFTSVDGDSALYAALSARLADQPVDRWIAPEWFGLWAQTGLTGLWRENPAGIFLLPAALDRLGMPAEQAAYVVGVGAGLGALLLIGSVIARLTSRADGRAALVLLQLMPVAFIFRIRANHEYPMLLCLLLTIVGLDGVWRSWRWLGVVALGMTLALVIKGVFVALVGVAAGLWILLRPAGGSRGRQIVACVVGLGVMVVAALAYDAAYRHATGETFWRSYWQRQLAPLTMATPLDDASSLRQHLTFYGLRLLWHPAPWSLALIAAAWRRRRALAGTWRTMPEPARRGLAFAVGFAVLAVGMLSPSSRFAERYAFSANYMIGAAGAVVAFRAWPGVTRALTRLDAIVPALPAVVWLSLILLRLTVGSFGPRVW